MPLLSSPVWREKDELLRSVPGVGEQLSVTLLAKLPELSTLDREQSAALVGVASFSRDSGPHRGKCTVWGAAGTSPCRSVPGGVGGEPLEPGSPGLLPAAAGSRQTQEVGPDGL